MTAQQLELVRVSTNIHAIVLDFCRSREGQEFYMYELAQHVYKLTKGMTAPDSAGRILRDLRQRRRVAYDVVSRHASLYKVISVGKPVAA